MGAKRGPLWSKEADDFLKKYYMYLTHQELAAGMKRSVDAVKTRIRRLKLRILPRYQLPKTGDINNSLEVVSEPFLAERGTVKKCNYVLCRCVACDKENVRVPCTEFSSGRKKDCGCSGRLRKINASMGRGKYSGKTRHPLYRVYNSMKGRCYKTDHKNYHQYGGRGISICQEWLESYESFYDWALSNKWERGLTIDRIDNDGGYSPKNCRITTQREQCNNCRKNVRVEAFGETHTIAEWSRDPRCRVGYKVLQDRIQNQGWSAEDALTIPKRKQGSPKDPEGITAFAETKSARAWSRDPRCVVRYGTLLDRIRVQGWSPERAIATPRTGRKPALDPAGVTAFNETKSIQAWSRDPRCVVCYATLIDRIRRYDWDVEKALTKPSQKQKAYQT